MIKRSGKVWIALLATLVAIGPASGQIDGSLAKKTPKAKVSLLSSVEAVVPGQPLDVAIHFELTPGWHIYWKNGGDSGQPPRVEWTLPPGFEAGELRFPVPRRHVTAGTVITNILTDEPTLLATITPPRTVTETRVSLGGKLQYLICSKKACPWEGAEVQLELPVRAAGPAPKPANAELFERARRALPKPASKYLTITPKLTAAQLTPGKTVDLLLDVEVARGFHIQSDKPLHESLVRCDVFLERTPGVYFDGPIYPEPHFRQHQVLGTLSEFKGDVTVRIPAEIEDDLPAGPVSLGGILTFQACSKKGKCFPPEAVAFSMVVGGDTGAATAAATPGPGADGVPTVPIGHASMETPTLPVEDASSASTAGETVTGDDPAAQFLRQFGILGLLLGCFLYGLLLNATPCVLPLLSIKVLGFVQQAHESRRRTLVLGFAFGAGVVLFFVVLGLLAGAGRNVLQYPAAVIGLASVVTALALAMLGVYTLQVPTAATKLEATIQQEGVLASFGKGTLAPVLGFACTGPLLAGAFGWATQQPSLIAVVAFLFAGLGMASPYMLLGANPKWLSFLPKPGPWMITFERIMGFLLLAMVVWLLSPLVTQIGSSGLLWTLAFLVAIGMACGLLGRIQITMPSGLRWRYRGGAVATVVAAGVIVYVWIYPLDEAIARQRSLLQQRFSQPAGMAETAVFEGDRGGSNGQNSASERGQYSFLRALWLHLAGSPSGRDDWSAGLPWRPWSASAVEEAVRSGKTVFVDFTAAYCTVCKANKIVAVNTPEVGKKLRELEAVVFQGDFTFGDRGIFAELQKHGRAAVPLNLIYPPGKPQDPIVLRPNLTKKYLLEKLDEAGPSHPASVAGLGP